MIYLTHSKTVMQCDVLAYFDSVESVNFLACGSFYLSANLSLGFLEIDSYA